MHTFSIIFRSLPLAAILGILALGLTAYGVLTTLADGVRQQGAVVRACQPE
jgi:hypothetical protein